MTKSIGNAVILVAGSILMIGGLLAVGIVFIYAFAVVIARRLNPRRALVAAN